MTRGTAGVMQNLLVVSAAACGAGSGQTIVPSDRLLLVAWNYPDTGVTRIEVQRQAGMADDGPTAPGPVVASVPLTGTLRSSQHSIVLSGSYNLISNTFGLARRNGVDSVIMLGVYNPLQPDSPVIADVTFSGPPSGNGSGYGIRDSTGHAVIFCGSYAYDSASASRSFGMVVTDSLVVGVAAGLGVPFTGLVNGNSITLLSGGMTGSFSADQRSVTGLLNLHWSAGHWSGLRCGASTD